MKLFGIELGLRKPAQLRITAEDRAWVESNFEWLTRTLGLPAAEQISISEKYFPNTFQSKETKIENLVADCCKHLELDPQLFSCEIFEDIRDTENMPYGFEERPVDCFMNIDEQSGKYSISIAKYLFKHPQWLIVSTCIEFARAKLHQSRSDYGEGEDSNLFLYLAAVYFGYGVIIAANPGDAGVARDVTWETKWAFIAELPSPVIAYALAVFAKLKNDVNPAWKELLSKETRNEFDLSIAYIGRSENKLFDTERMNNIIKADELLQQADKHYEAGEFRNAILILEPAIGLADDDLLKADIYNTIGYYNLRDKQYRNSIPYFEDALKLHPVYGYANDNLGFALIMLDEPEKGKEYLEKAIQTENNDNAYSFRNMALYHQKKGDHQSAEAFFQKAFDMHTKVDLLDFFYGLFLLENGDEQNAIVHIQRSADSGEYEGIEKMKTIKPG